MSLSGRTLDLAHVGSKYELDLIPELPENV